jgi:FkbM family methyltransferase
MLCAVFTNRSPLKTIIKALLRKFGIIAMHRSSRVYLPEDDSYRIALEQSGERTPVIIDGGAHLGATVDAFRAIAPKAKLHCFEPDKTLVTELQTRFAEDSDVHVIGAALGEQPGTAAFNINASRPTNSLLPTARGLQSDLQDLCVTVEQVTVPVVSIDAYCDQEGLKQVDIIKLDLQGYDYHALLGAKNVLQGARVVLVEVLFTEIYQGCHLFPDVLRLLGEQGFRLFTLSGIHYGASDELLWADAIFVKEPQRVDALAPAT